MTASKAASPGARAVAVCRWLFLPAVLPVAVGTALRAVPADWPVLGVQLVAFTPWLAVPGSAALALAFAGQRRWQQAVAAVLLGAQVLWLFPLDIQEHAAEAAAPVTLVAMTINA
ncbi:hypothetical protein [Pseudarthrobacter sp. efr-133-R2A-89]|uniref:hypothetical protein n=1 Tax=Pseudarthrobacter sp. efr-133-R2A-89 TaxID=3040302 RepID=UPI0025557100|nr:hypothetical protein [Pseudarthrobacter sp. efr-133-R2A-89]